MHTLLAFSESISINHSINQSLLLPSSIVQKKLKKHTQTDTLVWLCLLPRIHDKLLHKYVLGFWLGVLTWRSFVMCGSLNAYSGKHTLEYALLYSIRRCIPNL